MANLVYQCVMSFFASVCFGIIFQVRGRKLFVAGLGGSLGWLVYLLGACPFPASAIPRYFFATLAITIFAEWAARALRTPVSVFLAVSLIPLVPGNGIYQTMLFCIRGQTSQAVRECINTVGIAGALAMGVVVVSSIVSLFGAKAKK